MSKLVLDSFIYRKNTSNETYGFEETLLYSYLNKVMRKKLRVNNVRIPKLNGITHFAKTPQNAYYIHDYRDFEGWKDKLKFSDADISKYTHSIINKPSLRHTSNLIANYIYDLNTYYKSGVTVHSKTTATILEDNITFTQGKLGTVGITQSGLIYVYGLVGPEFTYITTLSYNIIIE